MFEYCSVSKVIWFVRYCTSLCHTYYSNNKQARKMSRHGVTYLADEILVLCCRLKNSIAYVNLIDLVTVPFLSRLFLWC